MGVKLGLCVAAAARGLRGTALTAAVIIGTAVFIASAGSALLVFVHEMFLFCFDFGGRVCLLGFGFGLDGLCRFRVFFCFGCFFRLGGFYRLFNRGRGLGCGLHLGFSAPHRGRCFHRGGHAVPGVAGDDRDLTAVQLFDAGQILFFLGCAEAHRRAVGTGAGRAPDTVDIGLGHLGQVVVEDMGQLADVNAAGRDIGGHQHFCFAGLEALQRRHAGGLALVAMDGGGRDALLVEVFGDLIRAVLGAAEHQCVDHRRVQVLDEPGQQELLVAFFDKIQALVDAVHGAGNRVHLDERRVLQDAGGQLLDLFGHGGAEHEVLALLGQLGDHFLHVVDKTHVQHPVGFVQHKNFNVREIHQPLPHQVVQPARAGDEDLNALFDGLHLRSLPHTAKDDGGAQLLVLAVGGKALPDLERQLPGGGEDQRPDGTRLAGLGGIEAVQHGQRESSGLAGARLGAAH